MNIKELALNTLKPILNFYKDRGGEIAWDQYTYASDECGIPVAENSPLAITWYLIRAIREISLTREARTKIFNELIIRIGDYMTEWNDNPNLAYEDVVKMLSKNDIHHKD